MSHTLFIHNKAPHNQEFEVHGWNNNHNIIVKSNERAKINAPDGSSGAIIALYNGHEGEQAEITKKGFGGNDFFDISNITGAGGNITIMQVGNPKTLKGHPTFMQALNKAWHSADQKTKNKIKQSLHMDGAENIVRMDAVKSNPHLEAFVHKFDDLSYVGPGATKGNAGDPRDNAQSSAAEGSKDILITYSNGDARPDPNEPARINAHSLVAKQPTAPSKPVDKKPGILLSNKSPHDGTYFFYDNYWNGNGTAGANFDKPLKSVHVPAGHTVSVDLPSSFKGRVQRGDKIPATWVEFQLEASDDHKAHGDVSVEQGNDGPATIRSSDGTNRTGGFTAPIHAPESAYQTRSDGKHVIASTMGNWLGGPNKAAIEAQQSIKGRVYVTGGTGVPDIASANNRFAVDFY